MDYYVIRNNKRQGPFTIEQLQEAGLTRTTKVWREGLADWTNAADVKELAEMATADAPPPVTTPQEEANRREPQPMPKTWLAESILVTLLCCPPFGIAAIVFASQVESMYCLGNYEMAEHKSAQARKMVLWGFGLGLVLIVGYFGFLLLGMMAAALQ